MKKKILIILITIFGLLNTSCFSRDSMEGITVYTTVYPVTYLAEELYGYNSTIKSVFPKGVDNKKYIISDKKIKEYAKGSSLFIYNGQSDEKEMAAKFLKYNHKIRIIDVSQGLTVKPYVEELWVSPSNYLMMALNIKNGLKEYISNQFIHEEIEENYDKIKINISKIEAELKVISELSENKIIVSDTDSLLFLKKYGFEVISIDEKQNKVLESTITRVKKLISDEKISYVFLLDNYKESQLVRDLIANKKITLAFLATKNYLNEDDLNKKYIEVMQNNLEIIKKEIDE